MKTKIGWYYIFFEKEEYEKIVKSFMNGGYFWIGDNLVQTRKKRNIRKIENKDFPIVLNISEKEKNMLYGIIRYNKELYFKDREFKKLYTKELRKHKLKKLLEY
jgi:hypothetical protein